MTNRPESRAASRGPGAGRGRRRPIYHRDVRSGGLSPGQVQGSDRAADQRAGPRLKATLGWGGACALAFLLMLIMDPRPADGQARSIATPSATRVTVFCWGLRIGTHPRRRHRPAKCGLYSRSAVHQSVAEEPFGHYMFGLRWKEWGPNEARGRGSAYRLWGNTSVRLYRPRVRCEHRVFTRARFRYVGSTGRGIFAPRTVRLVCR